MKAVKRLLAYMLAITMVAGVMQTNAVTVQADVNENVSTTVDGVDQDVDIPGVILQDVDESDTQTDDVDVPEEGTEDDSTPAEDETEADVTDDDTEVVTPEEEDTEEETTPAEQTDVKDTDVETEDHEVTVQDEVMSYDLSQYLKSAKLYQGSDTTNTKNPVSSSNFALNYGDNVFLAIQFYLPNSVLAAVKENLNRTSVLFTYQLPFKFTTEKDQPLMYQGMEIGTYNISGTTFSYTFNESFFELNKNDFTGWANLVAKLSEDNIGSSEDGKYTWAFPGGTTYTGTVTPDTSKYKLEISKENTDWNTSSLENRGYKVTVKSTGVNTDVVVTDTPGEYLDVNENSITVTKYDGATRNTSTLSKDTDYTVSGPDDNGAYKFVFTDNMNDGDRYTIEYNVNVDDDALTLGGSNNNVYLTGDTKSNAGLNNNAKVDYKKNGETDASKDTNKGLTINKTWLNKSGVYDGKNITWTIKLNADGVKSDLSGATIKDTLGTSKQEYVEGSLTIDSGLNQTFTFEELQAGVQLTGKDLTGTYTITYQTKPTTDPTKKEYVDNAFSITPKDGVEISSGTAYVGVGEDWTYITKECDTDNGTGSSKKVSWTVTVNVPQNFDTKTNGKTMTDTLPEGMSLVADSVKVNGEAAGVTSTTGGFSIELPIVCGEDEDEGKAASEQTFVITYETEISGETPTETKVYTNQARFYSSATANYTYKVGKKAPTAEKSVLDSGNSTGILKWQIKASDLDSITSDDYQLVLIETIPDGLTFSKAYRTNNIWWDGAKQYPFEVLSETENADGSTTVRLKVTADDVAALQKDSNMSIVVVTKVANIGKTKYNANNSYTNKAQWELTQNGETELGKEATATGNFYNQAKVLDKSKDGNYANGKVTYKIKVNQNELTVNNGDTLTLIDEMGSGLDYTMGSLKATYVNEETGKKVTETWSGPDKVSYDSDSHTLTIMGLEDAKAYTLTYEATTNLESGTDLTKENAGNSVSLAGAGNDSLKDSYQLSGKASVSKAGGVVTDRSIRIYKYHDGDGTLPLAGVRFRVYEVDETTGEKKDGGYDETQVTVSSGYTTFSGFEMDTLYCLVEVSTPSGYEISDEYKDGYYFCFSGQDEEKFQDFTYTVKQYDSKTLMPTLNINNDSASETAVKVKISKADVAGDEIAGAKLQIVDETQNVVASWTSGSDGSTTTEIEGERVTVLNPHTVSLEPGTYTLIETTAPDGYEKAESIEFVVLENGNVTVNGEQVGTDDEDGAPIVTMTDEASGEEVEFSKVDVGGVEIAGAQLKITDGEGNVVDSWTSEAGKTHIAQLAKDVTYTLTETTAPDGYTQAEAITFKVDAEGNVSVKTGTNDEGDVYESVTKVTMVDEYEKTTVKISKQAVNGSGELAGAKLTITGRVNGTDKDIEPISWTSGKDDQGNESTMPHEVSLQPGTYTLTEETAPEGYQRAESITFTINSDGSITSAALSGDDTIVMTDKTKEKNEVQISKADVAGKEIKGASLTVTDENGNVVDTWTSDGQSTHSIYVDAGTYTLTETLAPDGYAKAENITFAVDASGKVTIGGVDQNGKITMTDAYAGTSLRISKTDIGGEEVAGAKLSLYTKYTEGATDNVAATDFATKATLINHESSDQQDWIVTLAPGDYILVEELAPTNGWYEKANPVSFHLNADGSITNVQGEDGKVDENGVLTLIDEYVKREVKISKVDITNSKELVGAELTIKNSDGEVVESWTSGKEPKSVQLTAGTYSLTEVTAPNGYKQAETITFTIQKDGTIDNAAATLGEDGKYTIKMEDEPQRTEKEVKISKRDINGTEELAGAHLQVTNPQGDVVAEWDSEAGVTKSIYVQPGVLYTLTETTAPAGYELAESITFTVDTKGKVTSDIVDANGNVTGTNLDAGVVVMKDDYEETAVAFSKVNAGGTEIAGAQMTLTAEGGVDAFGNAFNGYEWTSIAGANKTFVLKAGTYTLHEAAVPEGTNYNLATDIKFTINLDGTITTDGRCETYLNGYKITMVDNYKATNVAITKVKATDKAALAGASLALTGYTTDDKGNKVADIEAIQWLTTTDAKSIDLLPGQYTLTETKAPDGYETAAPKSIVVAADGKVYIDGSETAETPNEGVVAITMEDKVKSNKYDLLVSKQDLGGKEIAGATLTITGTAMTKDGATGAFTDSNPEEVNITIHTDGITANKVSLAPSVGEYTLTETAAPNGYQVTNAIKFKIEQADGKYKVTVTENASGLGKFEAGRLVMVDEYQDYTVKVSKQDLFGAEVAGASMKITGRVTGATSDITPITWTSESTPHTVQLQPGSYTLHEESAPAGGNYLVASDITFTVDKDGKVILTGKNGTVTSTTETSEEGVKTTTYKVAMTDKWADHKVNISKTDINGTEELPGATLEVTGTTKDGKTIGKISWISTTEAHKVTLQPGEYTLTEITAPNGYEVAESIDFTVTTDGRIRRNGTTIEEVVMKDDYADRTITISKRSITSGREINGAKLTITAGEEGSSVTIDSWTSQAGKPHEVSYKWVPGTVYTLTEVSAPSGYKKLTTNITFTVDLAGNVTVASTGERDGKAEGVVADDGTLVVNNTAAPAPETTNENDGGDGDDGNKTPSVTPNQPKTPEIPKFHIYLVRTDEETGEGLEGGVYDLYNENGEKIGTYTTNEAGVIYVDGLEPGNYYFVEVKAPEGYVTSNWNKVFTITADSTDQVVAVSTGRLNANPDYIGTSSGSGAGTTGDNSMMGTYGCVAGLAAAALVLWFIMRRKRQNI